MYEEIRNKMRNIVEMPDRHSDLLIKLVRKNGGTLSKKKRSLPEFAPLTEDEIASMERIVREGLELAG